MSELVKDLKAKSDKAEEAMHKAQADADKSREQHRKRVQKARDDAAKAQKEWLDAEAAAALVGRDDAEAIAENLGLTLPEA